MQETVRDLVRWMSLHSRSGTGLSAWVAGQVAVAVDGGHTRADVPFRPFPARGLIPGAACTASRDLLLGAADAAAALADVAVRPVTAAVADEVESEAWDPEAQVGVDVSVADSAAVGTVSAAVVEAPACTRSLHARAAFAGVAAGGFGASSRTVPCPFWWSALSVLFLKIGRVVD